MSHIAKMDVEVKSLEASKRAVARMGGVFYENQKTHRFFGSQKGTCDHAFSFPGCQYEVGLVVNARGGLDVVWDSFESKLRDAMGGYEGAAFKQAYGIEATIEAMAAEGVALLGETVRPDGIVELEFAGL